MDHIAARNWKRYNRSSRIESILAALNRSGQAEAKYSKVRSYLALYLALALIFFILGLIASNAMIKDTVEEMIEERDPEECASLMIYLEKYCNEWGCKIACISYNEDGTFTVTFRDHTQKRYECVDGGWIEVPLEPAEYSSYLNRIEIGGSEQKSWGTKRNIIFYSFCKILQTLCRYASQSGVGLNPF